jgi:hypothetical protein
LDTVVKILPDVNNCSLGENSPDLVTLGENHHFNSSPLALVIAAITVSGVLRDGAKIELKFSNKFAERKQSRCVLLDDSGNIS